MNRAKPVQSEPLSQPDSLALEAVVIFEKVKILEASMALATMFGYQPSEIVGMTVLELFAPEARGVVLKDILLKQHTNREVMGLKKDWSIFPIEIRSRAIAYRDRTVTAIEVHEIGEQSKHRILQDLQKTQEDMEAEVLEGTTELRYANERLRLELDERTRMEAKLKAHARQQAAVAELGQRALAGAELPVLIDEAVSLVAQTLDVAYVNVLELGPSCDTLLLRAGVGWPEELVGQAQVGLNTDSQAGYALLSKGPVIVEDLDRETRFKPSTLLSNRGVKSGVSVIIQGRDQPFGVLSGYTGRRQTFTEDDVHFLQAVANVLAAAIERKRFETQTQEILKEQITLREDTTALYRVTRTLAELNDEQQMFDLVLNEYLQRLNLPQGGVLLFDDAKEFGLLRALMIEGELVDPVVRIPIAGNPSYDRLLETGEPVVVTDALNDALLAPVRDTIVELGIKSLLLVPISVRDDIIGALGADATEAIHEFTDREISLVKGMAGQLGIALENLWLHAETRRRAEQLAVLHELDRAITTSLRLDDVYFAFSRHANRLISYDRLSITLLEGTKIRLVYVTGDIEGMPPVGSILPLNNSTVGRVVAQGQPLLLYDVLADRQDAEDRPLVADGVQSSMLIPLRVKREIIGTWNISSRQTGAYRPDDLDIAQSMADQLAVAIENARLYDEIQQHVNELTTLNHISQAVTSSLDLQETLTIITDHTIHSLGVMAASVALYDEVIGDLWFVASSGGGANLVRDRRLPIGQGILGWVVQHGEPVLVPDVSQDPHFFADFDQVTGFITRSILCVPLQTKGQIIGAIEAMNKVDGTFDERDLQLLTSLAAPAATAIENARLFEQAQQELVERKRVEAALEEERALLARRVAERTADLSRANAELARAARLKDEFLASMSHELRTPLTAILGLSEVMREQVYGPLTEKQLKSVNSIEASGRHLLALINDILDLSKIEAGKLELQMGPVSVERICQASLQLIKQSAQKKQLKITSTFDDKVKFVQADERRFKQILVNLLSNAVKFTPDGGEIGLDVAGDAINKVVYFTVWDAGIGISPEDKSRLFQPFVQLDSRLSRQYAGTGLGLALVHRMVEMHHGRISLESELGRGSRFCVSLPWSGPVEATRQVVALGSTAPAQADKLRFERALVIEDSPTSAEQLTRYLSELGLTTAVHPQGEKVIPVAMEFDPDIIILDIILPDSSGWEVLAQLKAEPRTQHIPVLIVSVIDEPSQGKLLGAVDHLVKPISQQQLSQALKQISPRPLDRADSGVSDQQPEHSLSTRTQPPLVLLAEDEDNVSKLLADYLIEHGYRTATARNGIEVFEQAKKKKPDIILMDIQMPEVDGLEATRRIRADAELSTTPIVALTALAMAGDRERCLAAGANEYLSKPISLKELTKVIETQLSPSQLDGEQ